MDHLAPTPLPTPALPQAGMLSYLTTATTPTRVRHIASRALRLTAFLHLAFAILIFLILAYTAAKLAWIEYHEILRLFGTPTTIHELLSDVADEMPDGLAVLFLVVASATLGTAMWACAGPVSRGRKLPARFAVLTLIPDFLLLLILAMGAFTFFLGKGFGLLDPPANPWALLMLLPGALAILALLLLKDLAAFLLWIARNPITEKPPVKFLP